MSWRRKESMLTWPIKMLTYLVADEAEARYSKYTSDKYQCSVPIFHLHNLIMYCTTRRRSVAGAEFHNSSRVNHPGVHNGFKNPEKAPRLIIFHHKTFSLFSIQNIVCTYSDFQIPHGYPISPPPSVTKVPPLRKWFGWHTCAVTTMTSVVATTDPKSMWSDITWPFIPVLLW